MDEPAATGSERPGRARWVQLAPLIGLTVALGAGLVAVQWGAPGLVGGDDGYYHIKMAWLMRSDLTPAFPWLPLTILSPERYVDHHWLFHVLMIPFTGGDLLAGAQLAAGLFALAALLAAYGLLRSQRVPLAALWTVGVLGASSAFVYRLSMPRAQSLSLLWLLVALALLLAGRHPWLLPLGATYVWLYDAFPLVLLVAGSYFVAARVLEGEWRPGAVAYPALGVAIGLVLNPYFPWNLAFLYHHLVAKVGPTAVPVGNEWYPYDGTQLLGLAGPALAALVAGAVGLGLAGRRMSLGAACCLALAAAFGYLLLGSRRFVEYFPPFAVLFCAFAWQPLLAEASVRPRRAAALLVGPLVAVLALSSVAAARASVQGDRPAADLSGAARWLAAHSPAGSRVFQTDWDDFPRLFFYNSHNEYIIGLDPTFLERADPALYREWVDLTKGRGLDVAQAIRRDFGADWVISDLGHDAFLDRAAREPGLREVFRDATGVVFQVEPPPRPVVLDRAARRQSERGERR
jgi:hypothetical protein